MLSLSVSRQAALQHRQCSASQQNKDFRWTHSHELFDPVVHSDNLATMAAVPNQLPSYYCQCDMD
jgi:hypothetical protein